MILDGIDINPKQLFTRLEVLDILEKDGGTDRGLSIIRNEYDKTFGGELVFRYPIMAGDALGTVIIPVREGFLSIGYNTMNREDYEIYDLDTERLLSERDIEHMKDTWMIYSKGLVSALCGMWDIQYAREQKADMLSGQEFIGQDEDTDNGMQML